jgi:hypothetical protein
MHVGMIHTYVCMHVGIIHTYICTHARATHTHTHLTFVRIFAGAPGPQGPKGNTGVQGLPGALPASRVPPAARALLLAVEGTPLSAVGHTPVEASIGVAAPRWR